MATVGPRTPAAAAPRSGPMAGSASAATSRTRGQYGGRNCSTLPRKLKGDASRGSLASVTSMQSALGGGSGRKAKAATLRPGQFNMYNRSVSRSSICSTASSVAFPTSAASMRRRGGGGGNGAKTVAPKVRVMVRIRPPSELEDDPSACELDPATGCIEVLEAADDESESASCAGSVAAGGSENMARATLRVQNKNYTFDRVFLPAEDQERVFLDAGKPIADSALEGFNASIFAYGQTGSGKTHTMQGPDRVSFGDARGLIPRMLDYCFLQIDKLKDQGATVVATVQYLEIYNELVYDLLDSPTEFQASQPGFKAPSKALRENTSQGVFVMGAVKESIGSSEEASALIGRGASNRHVASTNMNRESSRSHSIFTLELQIKTPADEKCGTLEVTRTSKINLIDLAGSERQSATQAVGDRLDEAKSINKSLSSLGMVISALSKSDRGGFNSLNHIPYRDSKLTHLLRDSLGGNTMTSIIATVSASNANVFDTTSTLQFGTRAKKIRLLVQANMQQCSDVPTLRKEIKRLKAELSAMQKDQPTAPPPLGQQPSAGGDGNSNGAEPGPAPSSASKVFAGAAGEPAGAAEPEDGENSDPNDAAVVRALAADPNFVRLENKLASSTPARSEPGGGGASLAKDSSGQTVLRQRIAHLERVLLEMLGELKAARGRRAALETAKMALTEEVEVLRDELDCRCNATACGAEERAELVKEAVANVELAKVVRQNRELLLQLDQAAALGTTEMAIAARARAVEDLQEQQSAVLMDKVQMESLAAKRLAKIEELKKVVAKAEDASDSDALNELHSTRLELRGAKDHISQLEDQLFALREQVFPPNLDKLCRRHSEAQHPLPAGAGGKPSSPEAGAIRAAMSIAADALKSAAKADKADAPEAGGASSLRPLNLGPLLAAAATSAPPSAPFGAMSPAARSLYSAMSSSTATEDVPSAQELVDQRLAKHAYQKDKDLARVKKELRRKSLQCEEAKKDYKRIRQSLTSVTDQYAQGSARNVELELEVQRLRQHNERLVQTSHARQIDIEDKDQRIAYLEAALAKQEQRPALPALPARPPAHTWTTTDASSASQQGPGTASPSAPVPAEAAAADQQESASFETPTKKPPALATTMSVGEFFPTNASEETAAALHRARSQGSETAGPEPAGDETAAAADDALGPDASSADPKERVRRRKSSVGSVAAISSPFASVRGLSGLMNRFGGGSAKKKNTN